MSEAKLFIESCRFDLDFDAQGNPCGGRLNMLLSSQGQQEGDASLSKAIKRLNHTVMHCLTTNYAAMDLSKEN